VNHGKNTLGNGLLVFLVSFVSALYDRYHLRLKYHLLVFVGYSTFYLSVVINKQLLSIQNNLLRKWCLRRSGQHRSAG
jgi:uncharacterized membrane protein